MYLSRYFQFTLHSISWSYNPKNAVTLLVWANPRSLATTYGITFVFFSSAYLDVSVQRVCPSIDVLCLQHSGLPHSGIAGSIRVCRSPALFAAYHAFLRLWEPRHPPYALILLIVLVRNTSLCARYSCAFYFVCFLSQYVNELFNLKMCQFGNLKMYALRWAISKFSNYLISKLDVENIGVEPMTSCVQGRRSSQLS